MGSFEREREGELGEGGRKWRKLEILLDLSFYV
uniref:Uncharacterized protein n=1 Tax=Cucumis melo TaxID=3656 RepID=A0A9I9EHI6_CUCME